ncbi:MAG: ADP compounds hydrolase NudE [Gammaproteobacteria bacterium]|nr:ADP compounds hydrolase NudE [Gammaproteobacteria bacterium]
MPKKPRILNTETLARTRLFHVEALELEFSNGVRTHYERLMPPAQGNGAVLVVPMLDEDTFLMIREYAAGVHRYELTLPKGRVEAGEDFLAAANREMMEEIGYGANRLEHLSALSLAPGYLGHTTQVVLARELYEQKLEGDEPEELEVVPWRMSELHKLTACEECTEARTIAALFLTRERLHDGR